MVFGMICQLESDALFFGTIIARADKYFCLQIMKLGMGTASIPELASGNHRYELDLLPILERFVQGDGLGPSHGDPGVRIQLERPYGILDGCASLQLEILLLLSGRKQVDGHVHGDTAEECADPAKVVCGPHPSGIVAVGLIENAKYSATYARRHSPASCRGS